MKERYEAPLSSRSGVPPGLVDAVIVGLAVVGFLVASCIHLSLPGLEYDECLAAAPAVNFVESASEATPMQIRPSVIHLRDRPLPIMIIPYIGPVKTLAHIPVLALLGISPVTVRLLPVLVCLVSVLLAWILCRALWDRWVANATILLLALDPAWVYALTRDVGPASLAVLLKLVAVLLGFRWWRTGGLASLGGAAFALGLGVSHKVDFLWVVAGLLLPLAILALRGLRERLSARPAASALVAVGSFLVGAVPVVAFNVATGGRTFAPFLRDLLVTGRSQHLGRFVPAIRTRLEQMWGLLSGGEVHGLFFGSPGPAAGESWILAPSLAVAVAVVFLSVREIHDRLVAGRRGDRPTAGVLLHLLIVLVASSFSPWEFNSHHLLTLWPVPPLLVALALRDLAPAVAPSSPIRRGAAVLLVTVVLASQLTIVVGIDRRLRSTGGVGFWSDAIYRLAEDLEERREPVVLLDWGFTNNLIVLTEGRLPMVPAYREMWRHEPSPELFGPYVAEGSLYLLHSPEFSRYPVVHRYLRELTARKGLVQKTVERYHQRDGRELYRLIRLTQP